MRTKNYPPFPKFLLGLFFIFWLNYLNAQSPFLVKDINQTEIYTQSLNSIVEISETDNYACFFVDDGRHGYELWITDGTPFGTRLLKDIYPGKTGSGSSIGNFCRLGNELYFPIKLGTNLKPELWKTDGTPEGTVLVSKGPFVKEPEELTALGNKIIFKTSGYSDNYTLWVSDGTAAGTVPIKVFNLFTSVPYSFTPYQDGLLFTAGTQDMGLELWKTDGTTNGTVLVKDIYPGSKNSSPGNFTLCKNKVYFTCFSPDYGYQIWMTDGTANGTTLLKHLQINNESAYPTDLVAVNDSLYFAATSENYIRVLWKSDGSANNTIQVKGSELGQPPVNSIRSIFLCDSFIVTTVLKENSWELWRKNGTDGNYFKFKEHTISGVNNFPSIGDWVNAGKHSFFSYKTYSDNNDRLWITDGTENGTYFLKNIEAQVVGGRGSGFFTFGNDLYFTIVIPQNSVPLWKSDGTPEGTRVIKQIFNETNASNFATWPAPLGDTLFFIVSSMLWESELWRSQGSGNNTSSLTKIKGYVNDMKLMGDHIFFTMFNDNYQTELWKMNLSGTIKTKLAGPFESIEDLFIEWNGKLYFSGSTITHGPEPWVTDGTPEGTKMLLDINIGPYGSDISYFSKSDTHLFFFANDGINGYELWSVDINNNVLSPMKDIIPRAKYARPLLLGLKGRDLYFIVNLGNSPQSSELWKSDGTSSGTEKIGPLPIIIGPAVHGSIFLKNTFYFSAEDVNHGKELWQTDGTISGTVLLKDIDPTAGGSGAPTGFNKMDSIFFFYAFTPSTGREPWVSDGTAAGTHLIKDINAGSQYSNYEQSGDFFNSYNGKAYFDVWDENYQPNLWVTDGKPEGTYPVSVLDGNNGYLNGFNFFPTPSKLYIWGDSYFNRKGYGGELWSLRWCNDSILSLPAATDISFNHQPINDTTSCRCNILGELMDKVISNGANPITGKIISKVWIQETEPTDYVNKVYEILPENRDSMATGTVTLYFTQEDFDAFNQNHDHHLPENPFDTAGTQNLYVELRKGESKNGSGLPVSFKKQRETIQPGYDQIRWDSAMNRWEIEVAVTEGFGGFFVKADSCLLSESFTWRGSNSDDWDNENNWLEKAKPSMGADIIIPSFRRFYPLISQNIVIRKLLLEKGATLRINPGIVIDINDKICR